MSGITVKYSIGNKVRKMIFRNLIFDQFLDKNSALTFRNYLNKGLQQTVCHHTLFIDFLRGIDIFPKGHWSGCTISSWFFLHQKVFNTLFWWKYTIFKWYLYVTRKISIWMKANHPLRDRNQNTLPFNFRMT